MNSHIIGQVSLETVHSISKCLLLQYFHLLDDSTFKCDAAQRKYGITSLYAVAYFSLKGINIYSICLYLS